MMWRWISILEHIIYKYHIYIYFNIYMYMRTLQKKHLYSKSQTYICIQRMRLRGSEAKNHFTGHKLNITSRFACTDHALRLAPLFIDHPNHPLTNMKPMALHGTGIFTYIDLLDFGMVHVGQYTLHGCHS